MPDNEPSVTTPPVCRCGHQRDDHNSGGVPFPHPRVYGVCLIPRCDCRQYEASTDNTTLRAA